MHEREPPSRLPAVDAIAPPAAADGAVDANASIAPAAVVAPITSDVEAFMAACGTDGRLFGLDLGTKTIGIALSDVTRMIASPLETIVRRKFGLDAARLLGLAGEHDIRGLVLGLPVNLDGSEGPRAQSTRAFARNIARLSQLPILLWDERLTTQAAQRMLIDADTSRKRRAEVIDKLAATIILQGCLDRMRLGARL